MRVDGCVEGSFSLAFLHTVSLQTQGKTFGHFFLFEIGRVRSHNGRTVHQFEERHPPLVDEKSLAPAPVFC